MKKWPKNQTKQQVEWKNEKNVKDIQKKKVKITKGGRTQENT